LWVTGTLILSTLMVSAGLAHSTLVRSQPPAGATLTTPPGEIILWFNERLERQFHAVTVSDGQGRTISTQNPHVDRADPTKLTVAVEPLPPGAYRVRWRVLSRDGHVAEGAFSFSIQP
jgi:methionine-rich copper-binding protein CopC